MSWDNHSKRFEVSKAAWDTHESNFPMLRKTLLPNFDQAYSAFMEDLDELGICENAKTRHSWRAQDTWLFLARRFLVRVFRLWKLGLIGVLYVLVIWPNLLNIRRTMHGLSPAVRLLLWLSHDFS